MYQGHKSRAAWNVSLWINNDEGLYRMAKDCIRHSDNRREAAASMLNMLEECGATHTPDGYRYTVTTIRAAMVGL